MIAMIVSGIIAVGRIHEHVNSKNSTSEQSIGYIIGKSISYMIRKWRNRCLFH